MRPSGCVLNSGHLVPGPRRQGALLRLLRISHGRGPDGGANCGAGLLLGLRLRGVLLLDDGTPLHRGMPLAAAYTRVGQQLAGVQTRGNDG